MSNELFTLRVLVRISLLLVRVVFRLVNFLAVILLSRFELR